MQVYLQVEPQTHSFTRRYRFTLPASDTTSVVQLNLNGHFRLQQVLAPRAGQLHTTSVVQWYGNDTLH